MQLRPATVDDVERVKEIRHAAFSAHAPAAYSPEEVEHILDELDEPELVDMVERGLLFVAVIDGKVCGTAGWLDGIVRHVYVAPELARTGIGSALLAHAERDFVDRNGAREVWLGAVLYARGFYEANGYEVRGVETHWDGSTSYLMSKELSASSTL
jgi:ribosomal protein S18 acetylase RimI-like enzyme